MITKRSEFMRTLERESQSRAMGLNNTLSRKPLVFAPENYAPDPSREDCRILPCTHFISKPDDTTKRIAPQTVVDVLDGKYKDKYDLLYIIDCRFPYEFEGGHIKTAVNVNTTNELEKLLLQPAITDKRVLLIFHCEFSCERGPRMARHLRNQDRAANTSHYPAVFYPEIYVMEGGYSGFFKDNRGYCWPEAYVEMRDEKHSKEFEEHMRTFGREFSRSASKGFLGTESRKSRSENDSSQASYASKGKPTNNTLTTSKTNSNSTTTSVSSPNPTSAARSANTRSTNAVSSKSTENHNSSKNSPSNIEVSSSKNNTSTSTNKNHSNEPKHSTRETSKVSNKNTFSSVLSSVKAAALLGSPSSPLSLPATSKTFVPSQSILSRFLALQRPIARPRNSRPLAERVLKDLSKPAVACTSTVSDATATNKKIQGNPASNYNPNLNSNTLPNPFFSGFRQTKPVFRGASP
ncbi:cell division cycle- protein [Entomortierella beljakovae]|nr:cell division cycle- protein [Entomortierella beljakovae]